MFEYVDLARLDAAGALGVLEDAQQARRHAEVQEALAMLRVVKAYRHQIPTDKVRLGGDGTGLIDDFACLELGAALHRSVDSVTPQVEELLNLEARLPRLWEQVVACGVPVWLGRRIARVTATLWLARALWVDSTIAPFTTRLAPGRLLRFVEALAVQADPAAAEQRWTKGARPKVEIGPCRPDGMRDIYGWLAAADAPYLDAAPAQLSGILAGQGSPRDAAERRAIALGILATPARALALIQHSLTQPTLTEAPGAPEEQPSEAPALHTVPDKRPSDAPALHTVPDERPSDAPALLTVPEERSGAERPNASRRAAGSLFPEPDEGQNDLGLRSPFGCAGHTCGTITVPPDQLLPKATLVIHLSDHTLTTGIGIGRCEQLGPVTHAQIRELLAHSRVVVRPVFNPNGIIPVDAYEIPAAIRRAVLQRHPYEIFPYATGASTGLDLDHTKPFRFGPDQQPGQTRPDNLGPLRRKTHRAKTHAGWQLTQPQPGHFSWTSPLGRSYLVTSAGLTDDYSHSPGTRPWDNPLGGPLLPDSPEHRRSRRRVKRRRTSRPQLSRVIRR